MFMYREMHAFGSDERAQSSVIVVLVFVSALSILLSIVTSSYVPTWMEDDEAEHSSRVENEFMSLDQLIWAQARDYDRTQNMSLTASSTLTLGVHGVPLFGHPSSGVLYINSFTTGTTIDLTGGAQLASSSGSIDYHPLNQFYPNDHITYENGAIVKGRFENSNFIVEPMVDATIDAGGAQLSVTLVSVSGAPDLTKGTGAVNIRTQIRTAQERRYDWPTGENITLTIATRHPDRWAEYYNTTLRQAGFGKLASFSVSTATELCTVQINGLSRLEATIVGVNAILEK